MRYYRASGIGHRASGIGHRAYLTFLRTAICLEKIKTIGDGYMAVCALGMPRLDHDKRTLDFALEMLSFVRRFSYRDLNKI